MEGGHDGASMKGVEAATGHLCAAAVTLALVSGPAAAQSSEDVNKSNNPLAPTIGFNLQDLWAPKLYDSDADTNAFLLRGTLPHKLFGSPQILRATMPFVSAPAPDGSNITGLGDINLFDIVLFKAGGVELGVGPQLTIPSASHDSGGTGKWQAGLATAVIAPQKWGLLGGLVTWQHSFAGRDDRPTQKNLSAQPFVIYNLPAGWYLRSSATMNFDLQRGSYVIPVGAGAGKVWVLGDGTTVNAFLEPQWTVAHDGVGQPKFQVLAGVALQFPIGR